ncbi:hypothetical protein B0T22DRAFT_446897 [Podospora appendiculata]|uniref:Uncharacterized protein n=1 Tax=Podospora appendiculata TaxID=314037 RepID=A0AAE1CFC8_9PEZI|nr:hypothetical protein B0T22DRAFT_446897 [Podospora appendiculata]
MAVLHLLARLFRFLRNHLGCFLAAVFAIPCIRLPVSDWTHPGGRIEKTGNSFDIETTPGKQTHHIAHRPSLSYPEVPSTLHARTHVRKQADRQASPASIYPLRCATRPDQPDPTLATLPGSL